MNGTDFRLLYEMFGKWKLAEYLKIKATLIKHISKDNAISQWDLEYNEVKFDVKTSSPVFVSRKKKVPIWDFSLRKQQNGIRIGQNKRYCDFFICIGIYQNMPKKTFLIPIGEAPTNHLRISIYGESKYNKYII